MQMMSGAVSSMPIRRAILVFEYRRIIGIQEPEDPHYLKASGGGVAHGPEAQNGITKNKEET